MGSFYMTATVADVPQHQLAAEVRELKSYVGPAQGNFTVLYPELLQFSSASLQNIWSRLSKDLKATILVSSIYDDDVYYYELWKDGDLIDQYVSDPSAMGEEGAEDAPQGGNAEILCSIYKCIDQSKIEEILHKKRSAEKYIFETDRHKDLTNALGLPSSSVGIGFEYIEQGEIPDGINKKQMLRLPNE